MINIDLNLIFIMPWPASSLASFSACEALVRATAGNNVGEEPGLC